MSTCDNCDGAGTVERLVSLRGRSETVATTCQVCDGAGFVMRHAPIEPRSQTWETS